MIDYIISALVVMGVWLLYLAISLFYSRRPKRYEYETIYCPVPLRKRPNPKSKQIGEIPQNTTVKASAQKRHWIKVKYKDINGKNHKGWAALTAMCPVE